mmetsp:Transcript_17488/g.22791  ORF Transcript_17488/g.22791 Transcript_17488/m.22791 type:complete len:205 (-) Transcript_17488:661-1275(-)
MKYHLLFVLFAMLIDLIIKMKTFLIQVLRCAFFIFGKMPEFILITQFSASLVLFQLRQSGVIPNFKSVHPVFHCGHLLLFLIFNFCFKHLTRNLNFLVILFFLRYHQTKEPNSVSLLHSLLIIIQLIVSFHLRPSSLFVTNFAVILEVLKKLFLYYYNPRPFRALLLDSRQRCTPGAHRPHSEHSWSIAVERSQCKAVVYDIMI